jgi:CMP/dCMP kinase
MKKIVIAIDGYSACGKSTTAREVAAKLNYTYIDSGAMYRAGTLYFLDNFVNRTNDKEVEKAMSSIDIDFIFNAKSGINETYLNGLNVEKEIRSMRVTEQVSEVSALPLVRKALVSQQRKRGKRKGVVMDGRDIGTNVFPEAELKIFMNADMDVRAFRRQKELLKKDQLVGLDEIIRNLEKRDALDTGRAENPLTKADDAYDLDTTHLTFDEQVEIVLNLAASKIAVQSSMI